MDGNSVQRALFDGAPVGLAVWDAEARFRALNARLEEINGVAAADHIGRTPSELFGELGAEAEIALPAGTGDGRGRRGGGLRGRGAGQPGIRRHWVVSFFPLLDGAGAVVFDITERRRALDREHAALEAAETAKARAEALARASMALGSSINAPRVLASLVDAVVPSQADFCAVHLVTRHGIDPIAIAVADPARLPLARALAERQAADRGAPVGPAAVARTGTAEINASITAGGPGPRGCRARRARAARGAGDLLRRDPPADRARDRARRADGRDERDVGAQVHARPGRPRRQHRRRRRARARQRAPVRRAGRGHPRCSARCCPPQLPEIPGVRLAARYRAAGEGNDVGGDFYDVSSRRRRVGVRDRRRRRQGPRGRRDHLARPRLTLQGRGHARRRAARRARAGRRALRVAPPRSPSARRCTAASERSTAPSRSSCFAAAIRCCCCCAAIRSRRSGRAARCSGIFNPSPASARRASAWSPATPSCSTPTAPPSCGARTPGAASRRCATASAPALDRRRPSSWSGSSGRRSSSAAGSSETTSRCWRSRRRSDGQ